MRRTSVVAVTAALVCASVIGGLSPHASAAPSWAPVSSATIHPGVQTVTDGGQCTANFVFHDATDVYIGQAAHCSATGAATATNGCQADSRALGTPVTIKGATRTGTMVYNSWLTMQLRGETNPNACRYNDFALVRLDRADHGRVNPTVPFWGGPTGIAGATSFGEDVYSYGNSGLRLGLRALSPKAGTSLGTSGNGWTHSVYTATPGVPGDSGSAFLDSDGRAAGVLSTLVLAPQTGSNNVSDLGRALSYMQANTSLRVQLALGTEPFRGLLGS